MSHPSRRFPLWAAFVLLLGCLAGGWVGSRVEAESREPDESVRSFGRILALVEDQFVGDVDSKNLVEHAIDGMLGRLDPHSNYLDPESFAEMRDEQRGKFHGLGIQITKRGPDKPLTIIAPIDGTPASRAGLQSGDIISHIEGEPTIDLTVQDAVRRLKGDKGTEVTITIKRPGLEEEFDVTVERDEIPIDSVRVAYMVTSEVGVVRIANFNTTTADELDRAIGQLEEQGMRRLILDLRGNPGGLLDQAVQVAERFIPPGKLVVYTRGRIPGSNQDFLSRRRDEGITMPLVVLVDHASASASEIVSGAIQDHDRGLVVGETTFGKGLVQRVIPLRDGGALAVTTAKYYTPAGRLIQRDYSDLDDYYLHDLREESGQAPEPVEPVDREEFHTELGRVVYGGGGITPDYIVPTPRASDFVFRLRRDNRIFDFAVGYVAAHPEMKKGSLVEEELLREFRAFLEQHGVETDETAFGEERDALALQLRAQVVRIKWDQIEEARVLAERDPQIQEALRRLDEAAGLDRRVMAIPPAPRADS